MSREKKAIEELVNGENAIRVVKIDLLSDEEANQEFGVRDRGEAKDLFRTNSFILSCHWRQFEDVVIPALLEAGIPEVITSKVGSFIHFSTPTGNSTPEELKTVAEFIAATINAIRGAGEKCFVFPPTVHALGDEHPIRGEDGSHSTRLLLDRDHNTHYRVLLVECSPDGEKTVVKIEHHYQVLDSNTAKAVPDPEKDDSVQQVGTYQHRSQDEIVDWIDFMVKQIMKKVQNKTWSDRQVQACASAVQRVLWQTIKASKDAQEQAKQAEGGLALAANLMKMAAKAG